MEMNKGTKVDSRLFLVFPVKHSGSLCSFCKGGGESSLSVPSTSRGHQNDLQVVRQSVPLLGVVGQI